MSISKRFMAVLMFAALIITELFAGGGYAYAKSSAVTVKDAVYPSGNLPLGGAFQIKGEISANTSGATLAKVWGGIYDSTGKEKVIYHEIKPNTATVELKDTFDAILTFGLLSVGDYRYIIRASDSAGNKVTLINSTFTIVDNCSIPSEISLTGESIPADVLPVGAGFHAYGQVSSTLPMSRIWGGIYASDGTTTIQYFESDPHDRMYDLSTGFGRTVDIAGLAAGTYVYKIQATDYRRTTVTLVEKKFKIKKGETAPSDINIYGATYPTGTLRLGGSFAISGTIISSYDLKKISGGIYRAAGSTSSYKNTYTLSYEVSDKIANLGKLDAALKFGGLPEGAYVYRLEAEDVKGTKKTLIETEFKISNLTPASEYYPVMMKGIDVSAYQGEIDWKKVKNSGIDFAILRAAVTDNSDAECYNDKYFEKNYKEAKAAGVKIGAYICTSAFNRSEMKSNIDMLMGILDGKEFDLPVYIDAESEKRQPRLGKAELTDLLVYGCELIEEAGFKAGIYSNLNWCTNFVDTDVLKERGYEIWMAVYYEDSVSRDLSDFCVIWQYSGAGTVEGIPVIVDLDYRYALTNMYYMDGSTIYITPSETATLRLGRTVAWSSKNSKVVSVDSYGDILAKKVGTTTITATEGKTAISCNVVVEFTDVRNQKKYYYKPVYYAVNKGIINGFKDDDGYYRTFKPGDNCTREDMILMIWKAAGKPATTLTKSPFKDVKSGTSYYTAVLWAYEKGITKGYTTGKKAGTFGVGETVTREDCVTFLYRFSDRPKPASNKSGFKDVPTDAYYNKAVCWAVENGITKGYTSGKKAGTFGVGEACKREHIVTFLYRLENG